MRRFSSYGPIDNMTEYYAPRTELIARGMKQLMGEHDERGGHYITVWAPRQTGKTWVMQQILWKLQKDSRFHTLKINLEILKNETDVGATISYLAKEIGERINKNFKGIRSQQEFQDMFKKDNIDKPMILILDEFDALEEKAINAIVGAFRNIHISRRDEYEKPMDQKTYLLHAVALIGVRSVLGIENPKGSPFNVQRSLHITNLSFEEVRGMFQWYEQESGQKIEPEVIEKLYSETKGQPGLTCWLAELLTEGCEYYKNDLSRSIRIDDFNKVYYLGMDILPNNNILNLIIKAKVQPYKQTLIKLFDTEEPIPFKYDDEETNYLYMNGIIEPDSDTDSYSVQSQTMRFASPLVQKRLFNYFSRELFKDLGKVAGISIKEPQFIFNDYIDIPVVFNFYQSYLERNKSWLFNNAPRRNDQRIYESIFHFNLYAYLLQLLQDKNVQIFPEFPTGNGKIDLVITYKVKETKLKYGIELKSFSTHKKFMEGLEQAAHYGHQLGLPHIYFAIFIESIDTESKHQYETPFTEPETGVTVYPRFIESGNPQI